MPRCYKLRGIFIDTFIKAYTFALTFSKETKIKSRKNKKNPSNRVLDYELEVVILDLF